MAKAKKRKSKYIVDVPDMSIIQRTHKHHAHMVWQALHYAQYEMTDKALKKAVIDYAKKNELDFKLLNALSDKELSMTGKYAIILVGGGQLTEEMEAGFARKLDELFQQAKLAKAAKKAIQVEDDKPKGPVLTVQDRMRMQAEAVGAVFDAWLDDLIAGKVKSVTKEMDPAGQMQLASFKAGQARWIKSFYEPELAMMQEVVAGKDKDLVEGYKNVQKSSALRAVKLLDKIITSADMIATVAKAQRKTRAKKAPSTAKLVAKLKYCEKHAETGVASVSPAGIIGAKEVWVYNTKYRKLGKYVAQDAAGLTVKGASIKDFSAASVQKTLRKPKEQLKQFMGSGKVKLRTFLSDIKAVDTKLKGRINANIVILKVVK
jgi:hypothetical protein